MGRCAQHAAAGLVVSILAGCLPSTGLVDDDGMPESRRAAEQVRSPHDPSVPDLTRGEGPDVATAARQDWYLHASRCRGWIYRDGLGKCDKARQILVTKVPVGSSLRRTLKVGDVILGVNGKYFSSHAVYEFRRTSVPTKRRAGKFDVILYRKGWDRERIVELDLAYLPLDFTLGEKPGEAADWNLGATGARGWIQGQHEETVRARQIYVTSVAPGSPADGALREGDVILGVEGRTFDRGARRAFGEALTRAETEEGGGRLSVRRFRDGTTENVVIKIEALGSYSVTTPWDCPKSRRILDGAIDCLLREDVLNEKGIFHGQAIVGALALLSTGEKRYIDIATEHVRKVTAAVERSGEYPPVWGYPAWGWGYGNLLLTEYHLLTGDDSVLPAIRKYSEAMARGQSAVGSWGHSMARENHGYCNGYGAMNQAGNICWMSLLLAKRCGVTSPEIEQAVRRGYDYLSFFIDKQSIPYGDHINIDCGAHDDNGKNSAAACAFSILGDRKGTAFYSRMTVASYAVRERGHTGNWWSFLWGPLGAMRAGPEACSAFLHEMSWLHDMERRWDGGFRYQGKAGVGYGVDPNTGRQRNGAEHQYPGWDTTGSRILMYCLPRKVLHITGKDVLVAPIPRGEIASTIEAGRPPATGGEGFEKKYDDESMSELAKLLGSWSPVVRYFTALSVSRKDGDHVDELVALLDGPDQNARYGACTALRKLGAKSVRAIDSLVPLLRSDDQLLQTHAIMALGEIGEARGIGALLELAAGEFANDPKGIMHRIVARALFVGRRNGGPDGGLAEPLGDVDREVLYRAARRLLRCKGGHERSLTAEAVLKRLPTAELNRLWPSMIDAMLECAPTGVMFASGVRMTVAELLAGNRIEEGMGLILEYSKRQKWHGSGARAARIMELLKKYGASAKAIVPKLEEYAAFLEKDHAHTYKGGPSPAGFYRNQLKAVREAIEAIRSSEERVPTVSIGEHLGRR